MENKMMRLSETVATSNEGVVCPLDINLVSPNYEEELKELTGTNLRFNFPHEYSIRVGMYYHHRCITVIRENDTLKFTCFDSGDSSDYILCKPYLYKTNGFPRSTKLSEYEDAHFFVIPQEFSPFKKGDKIVYEYVKETEETERHIIARHGKN